MAEIDSVIHEHRLRSPDVAVRCDGERAEKKVKTGDSKCLGFEVLGICLASHLVQTRVIHLGRHVVYPLDQSLD